MILSERQYRVTEEQLSKLRNELQNVSSRPNPDWVSVAMADALKSQIDDLVGDLAHYDLLRGGKVAHSTENSLRNLPAALIGARIAKGITQTQLAEALGMKPQQVQRYEATEYMGASLSRLIEVADYLNVKVQGSFSSNGSSQNELVVAWYDAEDLDWSRFPVGEMVRRGWIDRTPANDTAQEIDVRVYFLEAAGPQFATALHRKKVRSDSVPDEYALLAWQARVLSLASDAEKRIEAEFEWRDDWLGELRDLTRFDDGPSRARHLLEQNGILLIVEPHLPGTYLDGAAMLSRSGRPVVGVTLRYDRLDHFWFVLLHELGHVFLHLSTGLPYDFFDTEEVLASDGMESEANRFALDTLIPPADWDTCLSRFALTEAAVRADADRLGVGASIVAGRIRKERNDYQILGSCVGSGLVRKQFWG